eukprot:2911235-Amphidinium_carterae.1
MDFLRIGLEDFSLYHAEQGTNQSYSNTLLPGLRINILLVSDTGFWQSVWSCPLNMPNSCHRAIMPGPIAIQRSSQDLYGILCASPLESVEALSRERNPKTMYQPEHAMERSNRENLYESSTLTPNRVQVIQQSSLSMLARMRILLHTFASYMNISWLNTRIQSHDEQYGFGFCLSCTIVVGESATSSESTPSNFVPLGTARLC